MAENPSLLAALAGNGGKGNSLWKAFLPGAGAPETAPVASAPPPPQPHPPSPQAASPFVPTPTADPNKDARLSELLQRINQLTTAPSGGPQPAASSARPASAPPPAAPASAPPPPRAPENRPQSPRVEVTPTGVPVWQHIAKAPVTQSMSGGERAKAENDFYPPEPESLQESGLNDTEVEALLLKFFLSRGEATGRDAADQLRLPFAMLQDVYWRLKQDQLVVYRSSAPMNDYVYQLTDLGRERARRYAEHCSYFGSAPVALTDYVVSVTAQSMTRQHPTRQDLERAFEDLLISPRMMQRLGPAVNSGRGMFLFGAAGNGKTSIAERITKAFGEYLWIPRAIGIDGEIIRLFDPSNHEECPPDKGNGIWVSTKVDARWVRIRRPTIVVGGELTMDALEVTMNASTGISEAPVQLKSNCGTLVIDDFGRQKMSIDQLLNRWIVPLEKRYDYLNLPNGKKIQVPFDQLIVFSTNLQPKDLCDDAFLRRIPYKIEVIDPTEEEFRRLFELMCGKLGFEFRPAALDYLVEKHYKQARRPFRCCQPRDLLLQVRNMCKFENRALELSNAYLDYAVDNYFAIM